MEKIKKWFELAKTAINNYRMYKTFENNMPIILKAIMNKVCYSI